MGYSLLSRKKTKARKPHICEWCGLPTIVGSQYIRETSVYDGHMQNFAFHEACEDAANEYFSEMGDGEFPEGVEMPFRLLYDIEAAKEGRT